MPEEAIDLQNYKDGLAALEVKLATAQKEIDEGRAQLAVCKRLLEASLPYVQLNRDQTKAAYNLLVANAQRAKQPIPPEPAAPASAALADEVLELLKR